MEKINFSCPQCNKPFSVSIKYAGKVVKCECGENIPIPNPQSEPDATEPTIVLGEPDPVANTPASNQPGRSNFCPKCGSPITPNDAFCSSCGHQLGASVIPKQQNTKAANASGTVMQWYEWWPYNVRNRYVDRTGRASRTEYWCYVAVNSLIGFGLVIVEEVLGLFPTTDTYVLQTLFNWGVIAPFVCTGVRRMHDTGKSGWNLAWVFTGIGAFYVLYLLVQDSTPGTNQYGPNPKGL